MAIVDNYSKDEFNQIAKNSKNFSEFQKKLGYKADSSKTREVVKRKISEYNTDISHFITYNKTKRTEENVFTENSTVAQATLRRWFLKENYVPYVCSICEQKPIWQGKKLTLILDHINGINNDDRIENLRWVCPNCNQQLETTGSRNPNRKIFAKKYYCIDCGKEISYKSTRCTECFAKNNVIPLSEMQVTREELKKLIREKSFCEIGKDFNVSDNAIRKWCDKFNLPRRKSEINQYSDEAWKLI